MNLTLSVLRCPDGVPPETRRISGGEFAIGRGPDNDWVLPDPDRVMSKRHCMLAFRSGGWQVADLSSNGTFINRGVQPIGQGKVEDLRDGDRLRFGAYEVELRIEAEEFVPAPPRGGLDPFAARPAAASVNPFHDDPLAAPDERGGSAFAAERFQAGAFGRAPASSISLPERYDPLAPDAHDSAFSGPTQSDHSAAGHDAFIPPRPVAALLPDDWDLDLAPAPAAAPAPPVTARAAPAPPPAAPADPFAAFADPFAEVEPAPRPAPPPPVPAAEVPRPPVAAPPSVAPPSVALPSVAPPWDTPPTAGLPSTPARAATPVPPPPPPAAPFVAVPSRPTSAQDTGLLEAFLAGAGLPEARPADPLGAMSALGRAFRALVGGLRQALIARATIKGEFRIEQTMIRSRGNNPLKFSAGDDDALAALLGVGRRVDMDPADAVADALRDMRLHELASVSAMQTAVRALLAQLDPVALRRAADQGGGLTLVPAQRKARAWDAFEALHTKTTQALADDFDSVFGRAFARAYETALREATAREPRP